MGSENSRQQQQAPSRPAPPQSSQTNDPQSQLETIRRRIAAELNRDPTEANKNRLEILLTTEESLVRILGRNTEIETTSSRSGSLHLRPGVINNQQQQPANIERNANYIIQHTSSGYDAQPSDSEPSLQQATTSAQNLQPTTRLGDQRCSICTRAFTQQIYQCGTGHSVCSTCHDCNLICTLCHSGVLDMRNYPLEELLANTPHPCQNAPIGCKMKLRRDDMTLHLKECIFRHMDCPLIGAISSRFGLCHWKGRRGDDMLRHFSEAHPFVRRVGVNSEIKLRLKHGASLRHVYLVVLDNYFFFIHIKVFDQTMSVAVQLLGTKNGAAKWKYEIHMYNKAEPRRKLTYSDEVTADGDAIERVFAETRCLNVPCEYVYGLCESGELTYKVFITMHDQHGNDKRIRGPRKTYARSGYQNKQQYNA